MRRIVPGFAVLILLAGCGRDQGPQLSHGKPVAHWLEEMRKGDAKARLKAVRALGHVGKADTAALAAVIDAVKDRDAGVRREAILALMNLGPDAQDGVPALEAARKDSDANVRALAVKALDRIQGGP